MQWDLEQTAKMSFYQVHFLKPMSYRSKKGAALSFDLIK